MGNGDSTIRKGSVDGLQLYRSLKTIKDRYNVDFVFCTKEQTGQKIVEILNNDS